MLDDKNLFTGKEMYETYEEMYKIFIKLNQGDLKKCVNISISWNSSHKVPGLVVVYILLGVLRLSDLIF